MTSLVRLTFVLAILMMTSSTISEARMTSSHRSSNMSVDLLDANVDIRHLRSAPLHQIRNALDILLSEDDWGWTFQFFTDPVRRVWTRRMAELSKNDYGGPVRKKAPIHCIDAHYLCQSNGRCSQLYSDVIDACSLNRARIFGQSLSDEAMAFHQKKIRLSTKARKAMRGRKRKCRATWKRKMLKSRTRGPMLIGRSVPHLVTRYPVGMSPRGSRQRVVPGARIVNGTTNLLVPMMNKTMPRVALRGRKKKVMVMRLKRKKLLLWNRRRKKMMLKKYRQQKRKKMKMRHQAVATLDQILERMRMWAGNKYSSAFAGICENLDEVCPSKCFAAIKRIRNEVPSHASLMSTCSCSFQQLPRNQSKRFGELGFQHPTEMWDASMCHVQQRLVDKCRPKVYRGSPLTAQRPGCTSVWHKCLTSGDKCANAYRLAVRNCVGVIEGGNQLGKSLQCPLNCVGAMAGLYDKAPGFYRCRPDGMRRDWWTRWNRNMTGSCKLKCAFKSQGRYDALTKC